MKWSADRQTDRQTERPTDTLMDTPRGKYEADRLNIDKEKQTGGKGE